jgi:SAM-dependent methyltransferase
MSMKPDDPWLGAMWDFVERELPSPPASVLEIGCGSKGGFVSSLQQAGYRALGVDPEAPAGPAFQRERFEDAVGLSLVDAVVASTSLHHVVDVGRVLDRVQSLLGPGGTVVVIEWGWERFDERTARWCFERLAPGSGESHWLERHKERWSTSGLPWSDYLAGWAAGEGLHPGQAIVQSLDDRFERVSLASGPYLFPDLAGTDEADEAAAIEAGDIEATCIQYAGRRR